MTGALNRLRQAVAEQLRQAGVNAVAALEPERAARWREAAAAVALERVECAPEGFQDYLGRQKAPETGQVQEVYGRGVIITLALEVLAPRDRGAEACQAAAETAMEELLCRGAAGMPVEELQAGAVEFLPQEGRCRQMVRCRCRAWLVARMQEDGGAFTDFEVRGTMN